MDDEERAEEKETWGEDFDKLQSEEVSMRQLVWFLDIVEYLQEENGPKIKLYAQEIQWTEVEAKVLKQLNIEIVWNPDAFGLLPHADCFAFLPCCAIDAEVFLGCWQHQPVLCLGHSVPEMRNFDFLKDFGLGGQEAHINRLKEIGRDFAEAEAELKSPYPATSGA